MKTPRLIKNPNRLVANFSSVWYDGNGLVTGKIDCVLDFFRKLCELDQAYLFSQRKVRVCLFLLIKNLFLLIFLS